MDKTDIYLYNICTLTGIKTKKILLMIVSLSITEAVISNKNNVYSKKKKLEHFLNARVKRIIDGTFYMIKIKKIMPEKSYVSHIDHLWRYYY